MSIKLTKKQVNLLLRFTQAHKNLGMTPALAKVVALLTIVDCDKLSFEEIRITLGFSKISSSGLMF
jgi:DNA-binding transcriptional regulator GbsR (MarR family)